MHTLQVEGCIGIEHSVIGTKAAVLIVLREPLSLSRVKKKVWLEMPSSHTRHINLYCTICFRISVPVLISTRLFSYLP